MAKCFFTEMEFEIKTIPGDLVRETKVMFHDERSGFVGIATEDHKQQHFSEFQEFLSLKNKQVPVEGIKPVDVSQEEAIDKNAMVPTDKKAEADLSELASKEQTE